MSNSGIISSLLARLGSDYDALVTPVTTLAEPMSLEDLSGHLLTHEPRIEQHTSSLEISSFVQILLLRAATNMELIPTLTLLTTMVVKGMVVVVTLLLMLPLL